METKSFPKLKTAKEITDALRKNGELVKEEYRRREHTTLFLCKNCGILPEIELSEDCDLIVSNWCPECEDKADDYYEETHYILKP